MDASQEQTDIGSLAVLEPRAEGFRNYSSEGSFRSPVNLLDMSTKWTKSSASEAIYEGRDRKTMELKWTATPVDLVFGSSAELRAIAEVYAANDSEQRFIGDFVRAWTKVMTLDRFDVDYSVQAIALERLDRNGANTAP